MSISLKRKKIFQKGKCHSHFFFFKAFQISCNYFSFRRHFKWSLLLCYQVCELNAEKDNIEENFFNNNAQTCYSVFTETRAIQTIKTNQVAELKLDLNKVKSSPTNVWCHCDAYTTMVLLARKIYMYMLHFNFCGVVDWFRKYMKTKAAWECHL